MLQAARDYLNSMEGLGRLEASVLSDYNITLPISYATAWRWMRACEIYRDKFSQSYYNDKHQDPIVIEDRMKYIQMMDRLSLRMPLWLQLPLHEYKPLHE